MRVAWLLVALLGCKDKSETPTAKVDDPESPAATSAGSMAPKLEIERDRFGSLPGRVDEKQRAARMERLGKTLLRLDANGDRKVTVAELKDSQVEYLMFDEPKAVDADGDGAISVEELDIAIEDRRAKSRARWKTEIGRPQEP